MFSTIMAEDVTRGTPDSSRWERICVILDTALELPASERAPWVERECGRDLALRAEVDSLLAAGETGSSLLDHPALDHVAIGRAGVPDFDAETTRSPGFGGGAAIIPPSPTDLTPGQTIGRYNIMEKLGEGGMGAVYKALDPQLGRPVAVKVISRFDGTGLEKRRFIREARAASALNHPNIVTIYEYSSEQGVDFMAMEFIEGTTLDRVLSSKSGGGGLPLEKLVDYGCQIAGALARAHEAGIVHRDLKPANVMVTRAGLLKVLDFGLAKQADSPAPSDNLTGFATGGVMGTPAYMSPEQAMQGRADHRTDIFAFGIMLYEMACGRHPFRGPDHLATLNNIVRLEPPAVASVNPAIPAVLSDLIGRCLRKDRDQRVQSAGEIRAELLAALNAPAIPALAPAAPVAARVVAEKPRRRRLWMLVPASVLIAVAVFRSGRLPKADRIAGGVQDDYRKAHGLVEHYYRPRALETAIPMLEKIIGQDPRFAPAFADLGRANLQQFFQGRDTKYLESARSVSLQALQLQPDLVSAHVTLGRYYTQTGNNDLASRELEQALSLDKYNAGAYAAEGELDDWKGRNADAEAALQKALSLAPGDWSIVNQLGTYHLKAFNLAAASEDYRKAIGLAPDNPRAYNNLAEAYHLQDRLSEAEASLRKAISLEPTVRRYSNLGQILMEEDKFPEAEPMFQRALGINSGYYRAWGGLGTLYSRMNDREKSAEAFRKAIALSEDLRKQAPTDSTLLADVGGYYAALGMRAEAEPLLRQAAALGAEMPEVLYQVAVGYELLHQRDRALEYMKMALTGGLAPQSAERNPQLSGLRADARYRTIVSQKGR